jgi:hypothetical protein
MANINDTTTYPNTSPALSDHVPGTDVSDTGNSANGETVTFLLSAILDLFEINMAYNVNAQTGTTYTLVLGDQNGLVTMNNASPNTLTIPTNAAVAFPIGTAIEITALGAGTTTIAGDTGVTLTGNGGSGSAFSADIQTRYNSAVIRKIATDQWLIAGDIDTVAA